MADPERFKRRSSVTTDLPL